MTVSEIDITESETVYAVWGYDADGNGTADINDNTHKITVSTGDNGTATVEYSMDTTSTPVNALTKAGLQRLLCGGRPESDGKHHAE